METSPISPQRLASSVIAVPPLARNEDGSLNSKENSRIIRHIESGGVSTLLYGGNANLYHSRPSEYEELLSFLAETAATGTLVIPSAGPAYGTMMDQAAILAQTDFPTSMVLPQVAMSTHTGIATAIRHFVEATGKPAVLYWIKYAIVRDDPREDPYLETLVDLVDPARIISGIGEQPAITHLRTFGVAGFTSGCVCINPALSTAMLEALNKGDDGRAEAIRNIFSPLEDLRNEINPIRVLHEAVALSGIADTGPLLPLLSGLEPGDVTRVQQAATTLLNQPPD
jgi:dihydrodipicolinate synthase/N-acetylneuraminate lyase